MIPESINPMVHNRPLWRTAWRRLRRRPFQYIIFILGVALGVAMSVSIDLASTSASRAFQLATDAITGKATHQIMGQSNRLDETIYTQLRVEQGVDVAAPIVEGYVLVNELGAQPMRLVGVDIFAEPPFRSFLGGEQRDDLAGITPFLVEANTVILAEPVANMYGLQLGDTLTISFAGSVTTMRLVGFLQPTDSTNRRALSSIIFTDIATAQETLNMVGQLSYIDLIATDEMVANLSLPEGVQVELASSRGHTIQQMTAAFELNLTALSLLALVVGMFLIYNTVNFSVVQRRPLFGILRCLGVTGGQLFRLILGEAAVLSLIGSLLGLGLGIVLAQGMVGLVTQTINDLYFAVNVQDVAITPLSLVKGGMIGIVAALLASALPAWEAMKTTPQSTLRRSTVERKARRILPWLVVAWGALGSVGVFLLWLQGGSLVVAFVGLSAVLFSFALLTPPVTAVCMRLFTPIGQRFLGVLGRMAARDIVRSLSRTSIAIAALMVAVSVIIGVSIMIGSFRRTVSQWLGDTLQADIFLSPPTLTTSQQTAVLPSDILDTVNQWPGVVNVVTARHLDVRLAHYDQAVELVAIDGDVSAGQRQYVWQVADLWPKFETGQGIIVTEPLMHKANLTLPPEPLTLMTPQGPRTLPVLGIAYDYSSDSGAVFIGRQLYQTLWQDDQISTMGLFVASGQSVDALVTAMRQEFGGRSDLVIQSNERIRTEAMAIFDRTFAITAALRLLAIVVAFIGVLSALMSLQLERARELGTLRATGMTLPQLWQLTFLETGLIGSTAGFLAMPTGFALAWILIYVINVRSFGWTLQMYLEPGYFLQAFLVALIAALLAGIYPVTRLSNMAVATALRQE